MYTSIGFSLGIDHATRILVYPIYPEQLSDYLPSWLESEKLDLMNFVVFVVFVRVL